MRGYKVRGAKLPNNRNETKKEVVLMEYSELKKRHFGTNDTDKKLTDEEIIMRLERCVSRGNRNYNTDIVLDLIRRQKEEIEALYQINAKSEKEIYEIRKELLGKENLEESFKRSVRDFDKRLEKTVKLERVYAYKEFAEELKHILRNTPKLNVKKLNFNNVVFYDDVLFSIDNLLKEMVGEGRMTDNQEAEKALEKMK